MRQFVIPLAGFMLSVASGNAVAAACDPVPRPSEFLVNEDARRDIEANARERAVKCIHRRAYELAHAEVDGEMAAQAVLGACQIELQHAQERAYSAIVQSGVSTALPPGFILDAPPCRDGAARCEPWERKWEVTGTPPDGSTVDQGGQMVVPSEKKQAAIDKVNETAKEAARTVGEEMLQLARFRVVQARAGRCRA